MKTLYIGVATARNGASLDVVVVFTDTQTV